MKKLLKATSIIFLGCMIMSASGYAEEPGKPGVPQMDEGQIVEPGTEMLEREEAMKTYHEARLEAKKERIRARLGACGIDPDTVEDPNLQGDTQE